MKPKANTVDLIYNILYTPSDQCKHKDLREKRNTLTRTIPRALRSPGADEVYKEQRLQLLKAWDGLDRWIKRLHSKRRKPLRGGLGKKPAGGTTRGRAAKVEDSNMAP